MRNCAFTNCTNGSWKNESWRKEDCLIHHCKHGIGQCVCPPPVLLFPFPTEIRDKESRQYWTKLVNRKDRCGQTWQPNRDSRVCSNHFPDGKPTLANSYPVLHLGYPLLGKRPALPRKLPTRSGDPNAKRKRSTTARPKTFPLLPEYVDLNGKRKLSTTEKLKTVLLLPESVDPLKDHSYFYKCNCCDCRSCHIKKLEIVNLQEEVEKLRKEKQCLEEKATTTTCTKKESAPFSSNALKTDKQVRKITGLNSKKTFEELFDHLEPKAMRLQYWRGEKAVAVKSTKVKRNFSAKVPKRQGRKRKLPLKEEFLLVLMKLRMALSLVFLGTLFDVPVSTCSQIVNTWVKFLAVELNPSVFSSEHERDLIQRLSKFNE